MLPIRLLARRSLAAVVGVLGASSSCLAGFTIYSGAGAADAWFDAAPGYASVTFAEFAPFTVLKGDEYADLGVLFTDSGDPVPNYVQGSSGAFPIDGLGLNGNVNVELTFLSPTTAFGAHFPTVLKFQFFAGDTLLLESGWWDGPPGKFVGFTTEIPFDRVKIVSATIAGFPPFPVTIDNFYFLSQPIPAPGALGVLLGLSALGTGRRRRSPQA